MPVPEGDLPRPKVQVIHPVGSRGAEQDDPLDYRFDPAAGRWIVDPGWWRRIVPRKRRDV